MYRGGVFPIGDNGLGRLNCYHAVHHKARKLFGKHFEDAVEIMSEGPVFSPFDDADGLSDVSGRYSEFLATQTSGCAVPVLRLHALIFEGLLIGLTWSKTFARRSLQKVAVRTPVTTMLLKDGASVRRNQFSTSCSLFIIRNSVFWVCRNCPGRLLRSNFLFSAIAAAAALNLFGMTALMCILFVRKSLLSRIHNPDLTTTTARQARRII